MNSTIDSLEVWPNLGSQENGIRYVDIEEQNNLNEQTQIVINRVLADELELESGDDVEIGWYVTDDSSRK